MGQARKKIAIIGGGVGATTAAYAITQQPDWDTQYEITLYQLGWRMGGKGASGRNADQYERIEEHGLHIWAGFYANGFKYMHQCYQDLVAEGLRKESDPLGTMEKAFVGLNHFLLADDVPNADGGVDLHPWRIDFQGNYEKPWEHDGLLPTPFAYAQMLMKTVIHWMEQLGGWYKTGTDHVLPAQFQKGFQRKGLATDGATPVHLLQDYAASLDENAFQHSTAEAQHLLALARHAQEWQGHTLLKGAHDNDANRRLGYLVDLSLAFFRGAADSNVFRQGFDAIDDWEISAWLLRYGASHEAVYSAVFRGCYDYVFGYPGGAIDANRSVGAGTAIRGLLRLAFTYKGALFFKMQAGMGDTIFAPYYQILKHRGVKFKFFHAATNLSVSQDRTMIQAIDMVEQAEVLGDDYAPLRDVLGLPCWPSEPLWDQLKEGAALKASGVNFECEKEAPKGRAYRLERGRDFDEVILGASIGSLGYMTPELAQASERWRLMLERVPTVATHAAQFWVTKTAEEMGWNALVADYNSGSQDDLETVITSFVEPLDTWADMSDLLPKEDWPKDGPKSLAYFCSPAADEGTQPGTWEDRVAAWADTDLVRMWPGAEKNGKFDRSLLYAKGAKTGDQKFKAQYFRENFYGSERYVLSVPGSVQYRLPPDGSGFLNLYLAGDWTRCGINAGCVEAATISGLGAARGLTGAEIDIVGEGDIAPDAGPTDRTKLASPYAQTAPWPLTPVYGTGQIDGWFSYHAVDSAALQAVLPKGMRLHPQGLTPPGTHPVAILANQQMGVRMSILPKFLGFRDYFESIIAINFVEVDGHEGVFSYLPNLYLNNRGAQLSGVWFYGMNKRMGHLTMGNSTYQTMTPQEAPIWTGRYQQSDFARPLMESPECGLVQSISEQVVVTEGKLSRWQFCSFDFNFTSAQVAGVTAQVTVQDPSLANIPAGTLTARPLARTGEIVPADVKLPGAFRIWTSWTLSNPLDSSRIARLEQERWRLP
ncbi:MAG: NAD(P)-binding protein [Pseudomonadota bacterium]